MFTGIVSAVAKVVEARQGRLAIDHGGIARHLKKGASVAVNGACLTVVKKKGPIFYADVVPETLRRTNLGTLKPGDEVNLELPVTAATTLDGHIVQGHVDATAGVASVNGSEVTVALIPHTLEATIAKHYRKGTTVNLEADIIARYVARNLRNQRDLRNPRNLPK